MSGSLRKRRDVRLRLRPCRFRQGFENLLDEISRGDVVGGVEIGVVAFAALKQGNLSAVSLRIPAGTPVPAGSTALVILDVFPFYEEALPE